MRVTPTLRNLLPAQGLSALGHDSGRLTWPPLSKEHLNRKRFLQRVHSWTCWFSYILTAPART